MRELLIVSIFLSITSSASSQQPPVNNSADASSAGTFTPVESVVTAVKKAQALLRTITYTLERTDTLVSGDVRTMRGKVMIQVDTQDSVFGFRFYAKKDNEKSERIYDGHVGYETNPDTRTYLLRVGSKPVRNLLNGGGGHLIFEDLVDIDTSKASSFLLRQDTRFYYLTINYPDLTEYDVIKRRKVLTIDKATMLPAAVRNHQETLGKVQDLYYQITRLDINPASFNYDFSALPFLKEYNQQIIQRSASPVMVLKGRQLPPFFLNSFNNEMVSSDVSAGNVILLDFWEVWCSPCIESIPKVQWLYDTYKSKGLHVYGIINDVRQLDAAKAMVNKRGLNFPMLIGNEQLKKDYHLNGTVPLYMLIDKKGKIKIISEGYPADIETIIQNELARE